MKTYKSLLLVVLLFVGNLAFAQRSISGNGNVVEKKFGNSDFNRIEISGSMDVTLIQSATYSITILADENLFDGNVFVEQSGNTIRIGTRNIRKATQMEATISLPDVVFIQASGSSELRTRPESFKLTELTVNLSGASEAELDLECDHFTTAISGASTLKLLGTSHVSEHTVSGASTLKASEFISDTTHIRASGSSKSKVHAVQLLSYTSSGVSDVKYNTSPLPQHIIEKESTGGYMSYSSGNRIYSDTTQVNVGNFKVKVVEGFDSTTISVGNLEVTVKDDNYVDISRKPKNKKRKFNGHWSGVDLGVNGWLTPDFDMSFKGGLEYLDLRMEKSINVNVNLFEQNFNLNKKGNFGIYTGLGLSWNNYRFAHNVMLKDEAVLEGYFIENVALRKSKLVNTYITVPLFLEVQNRKHKLFFAAGVVGGLRIVSHTKIYYEEAGKEYWLTDVETGEKVDGIYKTPDKHYRNKEKDYGSFHMNPFKLDGSVRAGWGIVKLYLNYSFVPLFNKGKGPEVYPFAAGISFAL